jgi:anti-sigma B factor antagonist
MDRAGGRSTLIVMRDAGLTVSSQTGRHPETMIVKLEGPLTLPNIFAFQERMAFLKRHSLIKALVVDLTACPYMDSAGIGCIINGYVSAEKNGQKFYLAGANERIAALLETARVDKLIRSYPTVDDVEHTLGES